MSDLHFESALAHVGVPTGLCIDMREISDRGMIDLRGNASDKKFLAAVKAELGVELPKTPRTSVSWGDVKVLWLSTDQWLILTTRAKAVTLQDALRKSLGTIHSLIVDVSDMRAVIRLEGEAVRQVLMKGSSLDFLSDDYKPGTIRRLRFAEIGALVHVIEDNIFDIYVFRSYADYAWEFLLATAKESSRVQLFGKQA